MDLFTGTSVSHECYEVRGIISSNLRRIFTPELVVLLLSSALLMAIIMGAGGDPLSLARLGTQYEYGLIDGTEGYDGQFVYYIARDLNPSRVSEHLDVPAYRYQRILLPLLSRLLAFGYTAAIPWTILVVGFVSHVFGTWAVGRLVSGWGVSRWFAIVYGLWVGFLLALRLDLPETLAYGLTALGILSWERRRFAISWLLFGLAIFAKEVTLLFMAAAWLLSLYRRDWVNLFGLSIVSALPYAVFQFWLWMVFGAPGLGSGGEMATGFEIIPLMGLLRIWPQSKLYFGAMAVVFGPAVVLPAIWGLIQAYDRLRKRDVNVVVLALLLNAMMIFFLPFSTFRETGGLLRFSSGLLLACLLVAARYRLTRPLRYAPFWLVLNVFLVKTTEL